MWVCPWQPLYVNHVVWRLKGRHLPSPRPIRSSCRNLDWEVLVSLKGEHIHWAPCLAMCSRSSVSGQLNRRKEGSGCSERSRLWVTRFWWELGSQRDPPGTSCRSLSMLPVQALISHEARMDLTPLSSARFSCSHVANSSFLWRSFKWVSISIFTNVRGLT